MKKTNCTVLLLALWLAVAPPALSCIGANKEQRKSNTAGSVSRIRSMTTGRAAHTATLLPDGKVLVAGGFSGGTNLTSTELFDPTTQTFTNAPNMRAARTGHTATLLTNGKVLIAGGYNGSYLATAELYDPRTKSFTPTSSMNAPRSGHVATLLPHGKVLVAGGVGVGWSFLASAELYDPATNTFTTTGEMNAARESHTATLLADGKVLIAGGHKGRRPSITIYSSAEIYDPASGKFTATRDMTLVRHKHEAVLLKDGRVLILGGSDQRDGQPAYSSAEIYDPANGAFRSTGNMNARRYKIQGTAVLLNDGRILVAGGADRAELFDPQRNTFSYATGPMDTSRMFATATLLKNGQVLIIGGYHNNNDASPNAWIYKEATDKRI